LVLTAGLSKEDVKLHRRLFTSQKAFFSDGYYEKTVSAAQFLVIVKQQEKTRAAM
jgi:hypothetical protein